MRLADLVEVSASLAATRSRTRKVAVLVAFLGRLRPAEVAMAVAWLAGGLPGGRIGLGPATVGALATVPAAAAPTLSLGAVAETLESLRALHGPGSQSARHGRLEALFARATPAEQSFLARLLLGELRQGALEAVMIDAIASAAGLPVSTVRRAVMLSGRLSTVATAALEGGAAGLDVFELRLYEPVGPMLASPTRDIESALAALERAAFEYKLDGARAQIHKGTNGVEIYSRTGRKVTESLPEIVAAVAPIDAEQLIVDAEVIALEPTGRPRPFQETMRRFGRKEVDAALVASLPITLFCFDCLHVDGEDLIDRPAAERYARLADVLPPPLIVPRIVTDDAETAQAFLRSALDLGHEGVMAKSLTSAYDAGSRGSQWLKIKVAETLDLVVLAAEWGSGRRRGWLSNLHLGARDPSGGFVMLGKTFKGLTDETLAWQTRELQSRAIGTEHDGHVVRVRPELVVEVAFNELQASRRYPGGLALRFARVVRYRPDKNAAEADTIDTVRTLAARHA